MKRSSRGTRPSKSTSSTSSLSTPSNSSTPSGLLYLLPQPSPSQCRVALTTRSQKSHDRLDMLTRNRLANVSFFVCSMGELVVLAILAGILEGIITDDPDSNTRALSIVCAYSAGVWSESERRGVPALPFLEPRMRLVDLIPESCVGVSV